MMKTIKSVFDYHFQHVVFDEAFAQKVLAFVRKFLAKNNDHVDFFGGHLLGVSPARWNYSDTDYWWDEMFGVEPEFIQKDLNKLSAIKTHRVVSSDVLNHAFIYTIYRLHHSAIPEPLREQAKVYTMIALNMKFICSLLAWYFKYPADKGIAEKVFNSLSNKFDIKVQGSWGKVLLKRSSEFLEAKGRYYKAYTEYTDDVEIVKMLNDAQGRIRDTVKKITALHHELLKKQARIILTESSTVIDDTIVLKDLQRKLTTYNRYIKSVIASGNNYIKEPLERAIYAAVPSLEPDIYNQIQQALPELMQSDTHRKLIETFIDDLLTFSFDLLRKANIKDTDIPGLLYRLKHVYMSGRVTDPLILKARKSFDDIVALTDRKLRGTVLVPERCGVFLYIMLRTLAMGYYKD